MEKAMATHSSTLAWRIPGMEEPGGLPSMGSHRVGHDWSDLAAAAAAAVSTNQWIKNMQSCIFLCFTLCLSCLSNQAAFFWWGQSSNPHKRLYCNLDGQGSLVCCSPWFCRVRHDWVTELNWTELRRTLWGFPRTDFPYTMSSAFLLSVENL